MISGSGAKEGRRESIQWRKIKDSFPTNLLFDEGGLIYIFGIIARILWSRPKPNTLLISTYRPAADHLAAFVLKRLFPRRFYWIADYGDLPVDPTFQHVYRANWQRRIWGRILARADLISTVSEGLAKHLGAHNSNTAVIYNGLPEDTAVKVAEPPRGFRLSYTGSLYGPRDIGPILQAIRDLLAGGAMDKNDLRLVYAGAHPNRWMQFVRKYQLTSFATHRGTVSLAEAQEIQRESAINLLASWSNEGQEGWLTYKLFDYLAAGRPILAWVQGGQDKELAEIIRTYNRGGSFSSEDDSADVQDFIIDVYRRWKSGDPLYFLHEEAGVKFNWKNGVDAAMRRVLAP